MSASRAPALDITPSQTVGPYFAIGMMPHEGRGVRTPIMAGGLAGKAGGAALQGRVLDADGQAVADALIELWQPGGGGQALARADCSGADGLYRFSGLTAPAYWLTVFARGLLHGLFTRVYLEAAARDDLLARVPEARRTTLMAETRMPDADGVPLFGFDIHLGGARETVFFDLSGA